MPVVVHSQVNKRLAIDNVKRGTTEMEAGNLDAALGHFERAIELDRNYGAAYFSRGLVRKRQTCSVRDSDSAGQLIQIFEIRSKPAVFVTNTKCVVLGRIEGEV